MPPQLACTPASVLARPARLELATSWFVAVNTFVDPAHLTSTKALYGAATWNHFWTHIPSRIERPSLVTPEPSRLGHLSVSVESVVYRLVAEPANPNCVANCVRPLNVPRSLTAIAEPHEVIAPIRRRLPV